MEVLMHDKEQWYLLREQDSYYLLVRCSQSAAGFEILIKLSPDEYREFHACGRVYLNYLANRINYWSREYYPRSLLPDMEHKVREAISA